MYLLWLELLALSLAPVVFLFTYIYLRDEYEREPLKYLIISFLLGVLSAVPAVFLGNWMEQVTGVTLDEKHWLQLLFYAFVIVAFTEEFVKYLVLRWYNYPHKEFDEPYDGIMYGAAVSLGFAAIENVIYVFSSDDAWETGLLRMFTAVPAHAMFGVLMGYFVGKAKFNAKRKHAFWIRMQGLLVAILFHGLYDFFLFLNEAYLTIFAFFALVLGMSLAGQAIKIHIRISPHRIEETDQPS